jgi:putative hydrolase of the HAD superfamily
MSVPAPKFFYFDLGNVLLLFDHRRAASQMAAVAEVSAESVWEAVFESDLEWRFEAGELNHVDFYEQFCAAIGSRPNMDCLHLAAADIFSVNEPLVPIVSALERAGHRLGILSNTNIVHWNFVSDGRFRVVCDFFKTFALSFKIGAMKPHASIYRAAIKMAQVPPEQIFFIDDRPENVAGARMCGMDAVLFTTAEKLVSDLQDRGVRVSV